MQQNAQQGLGLGLPGLCSATNCADKILGRFTIIPCEMELLIHALTSTVVSLNHHWK